MREVAINIPVVDQFPVISIEDGYTKISGETSFSTTVWLEGVVQALPVTISEIGSSGEYKLTFTPDSIGFWKVEVLIGYSKDLFGFEYLGTIGTLDTVYESIQRLLGLNHENIFIDNTLYDPDGQLVQARVRIFDSKANCDLATDGGTETTGMLGSYTLDSVWDIVNQFDTFKQVRDL